MAILICTTYLLIAVGVACAAWAIEFHDHRGDPTLAAAGLVLSVLIGSLWPVMLALVPFGFLLYGIGKLIVRGSK